ncbi:DNA repair endonuclease XPF-like [Babylonia areolata]|uniref:DNA repair endonuclease XPF-like n=1 Tax=Babylonia areolata TaxID=304850 RepID=UPI003FD22B82
MALLEYENQIFLEGFHNNGLFITARGLGVDRIFLSYLNVYCDPGSLVLVLNTNTADEEYLMHQLESQGVQPLPKVITNEFSASDRQHTYLEGGVQFVTSRILVVDLLTDRVPLEKVTGILVYKAHKVIESCQEAFILRLFREKNKSGFIKAFSDTPEAFTSGFCHVERIMKNLFVKKLFLWPRFHASVVSYLNKHKVDVVELHLQLTPLMTNCQTCLLDLINVCIKELKRCTPAVDMEEITVETAMGRDFERMVRTQLDPVWHMLSGKTRQLVSDLKTLRLVLKYLTQYDCITFYNLVNSIRTNEKAFGQNTGWLFLDAADSLFVNARRRVFGDEDSPVKEKAEAGKGKKKDTPPSLEETPKWKALKQVLDEVDKEIRQMVSSGHLTDTDECRVLVCAEDDRTCNQLKEFLCRGSQELLIRLYDKYLAMKAKHSVLQPGERGPQTKRRKGGRKKASSAMTLTQMAHEAVERLDSQQLDKEGEELMSAPEEEEDFLVLSDEGEPGEKRREKTIKAEAAWVQKMESTGSGCDMTSKDAYYGFMSGPVTILHPLHSCTDPHGLMRTLQEIQPTYVVLYDPDMQFVRQLEVYQATHPRRSLRVYFLLYTGSVEEQRYLTTLRREKEAFEFLIREKATMVIPEERDGKSVDDLGLQIESSVDTTNSRKGGLPTLPVVQKVIVDMREFRSELPSLIHRRGISVEPVTLEIGDYILTPDICVERKSVSDLIGSLNNGRLYNQCVAMCRCYKRPVLLIEFDPNKSFSLQGKYPMTSEVNLNETSSRLALLTMHFPKLRTLWCPSPYATAEIFEELKVNRAQPDAAEAMMMKAGGEMVEWGDRYSHIPQDMVLRMPGVTSKNYRSILNKFENMLAVSQASLEELTTVLANSAQAKQLHDFFHTKATPDLTEEKPAVKSKGGRKFGKRKR